MPLDVHEVCVVVPVYRGERTLPALVPSIVGAGGVTDDGHEFKVVEVLLVHDCGPDHSAEVIDELQSTYPQVRAVWLSRNFGQHAATIAGMASSSAAWVVTMDEDGQHNSTDIGLMLDTALSSGADLVYGRHKSGAPHARWRNVASWVAKQLGQLLCGTSSSQFSSMRLVEGEAARAVAAYCGPRVYLDVALGWVIRQTAVCEIQTQPELREGSGYNLRQLASHFWTLVLSSGTRPLRILSLGGAVVAIAGFVGAALVVIAKIRRPELEQGWTSVMCAILVVGGLILLTLGVVAEYVGAALMASLGRPLYVVVDRPRRLNHTTTPASGSGGRNMASAISRE